MEVITRQKQKIFKQDYDDIIYLHNLGIRHKDIANKYDVTPQYINTLISQFRTGKRNA